MNKIIYLLLLLGLICPKDFICHEDSEEFYDNDSVSLADPGSLGYMEESNSIEMEVIKK